MVGPIKLNSIGGETEKQIIRTCLIFFLHDGLAVSVILCIFAGIIKWS